MARTLAQSRATSPVEQCSCGEPHHPGARYYVSVVEIPERGADSPTVLAAGPFVTHAQARGWIDPVRQYVLDHYNPHGRAHWYGYGTVAMGPTYTEPGKLNAAVGYAP